MGGRKQLTTESFITRSKLKYGDRYIYDKTIYTTSQNKVTITCRIHGDFDQCARSHYSSAIKTSCIKCAIISTGRKKSKNSKRNKYKNLAQPTSHKVIPLTKDHKLVALVSNEDFEKVYRYNWHFSSNGYAAHNDIGYLHVFIMGGNIPKGLEVDHIDRNKLNNQRSNLRLCSSSYNSQNTKRKSTSGFTGVHLAGKNKSNKWMCRIVKDNKTEILGYFNDAVEAARVYDKRALELYGPNAHVNFPKNIKRG